jgi:D-alanyl-D-alanine-carboxypeptidase/D-alanyl-D-alanine-endopeptidase
VKRITIVAITWLTAMNAIAAPSLIPPRVEQAILDRTSAGQNATIVIAIVDGDRSAVYAFGKLDGGAVPTGSTVYEIGSITKTFTATLLADSVIKGQLNLDQPVSTLLPDFKIPSKDGKVITLANLAEQNSGLPSFPTNMDMADPADPFVDYSSAKLQNFLATYTLPRSPGAGYEYSNLAVALLGYALARHADASYPALLKATIFGPLGMENTSVAVGKGDPSNMAPGHDRGGKEVPTWHFNALAAAGGVRSTGDDMLRYLKANMGLVSSSLLRAMQLAQIPRAPTTVPGTKIGLIWRIQHSVDSHGGPDIVWHGGVTLGYTSFIGFTADHQRGVVVLTNARMSVEDLGFATLLPYWPLASARKQKRAP